MKITIEKYEELSDIMLKITRGFNDTKPDWNGWSTGGWRYMSNGALDDLLKAMGVVIDGQLTDLGDGR